MSTRALAGPSRVGSKPAGSIASSPRPSARRCPRSASPSIASRGRAVGRSRAGRSHRRRSPCRRAHRREQRSTCRRRHDRPAGHRGRRGRRRGVGHPTAIRSHQQLQRLAQRRRTLDRRDASGVRQVENSPPATGLRHRDGAGGRRGEHTGALERSRMTGLVPGPASTGSQAGGGASTPLEVPSKIEIEISDGAPPDTTRCSNGASETSRTASLAKRRSRRRPPISSS